MIVDQPLTTGFTQAVLVEEQISKTVVDEGAMQEFHPLRLMRLTAADNGCAGFRHLTEVLLLIGLCRIGVIFLMLKGGDHKIALSFEAADLSCHPVHIADRCSRMRFVRL